MVEPERWIGRLFIVKGDLFDNLVETASPLIILPGYINRAIHPVTGKFYKKYPELRRSVGRVKGPATLDVTQSTVVVGEMTFAVRKDAYLSPHTGPVAMPKSPPERVWHSILITLMGIHKGIDSVHWMETEDSGTVDVVNNLMNVFIGVVNPMARHLPCYYYNSEWNHPPTIFHEESYHPQL